MVPNLEKSRALTLAVFLGAAILQGRIAAAGWGSWTPEQRTHVVAWVKAQPAGLPAIELRGMILQRQITGAVVTNRVIQRPPIAAKHEAIARTIAVAAGITMHDTPGQMDAKLLAWIDSAAAADKPERVYRASMFWTAYSAVETLSGSGATSITVSDRVPIYSQSPAETMQLGPVTCRDIKAALVAARNDE